MTDIVNIGFSVDSSNLSGAIKKLDDLKVAGAGVDESNQDLKKSHEQQIATLKSLSAQVGLTSDELFIFKQVEKSLASGATPEQTAEIQKQAAAYINLKNQAADAAITANNASEKMTRAASNIGSGAGQAGIQIQQFVGQVQGGVNPMIAFSQQATDLGFVLGAPLLGAIAGIAASVALVLLPTFFDAEDATDELADAQLRLKDVLEETNSGSYALSQNIQRLAETSEGLARIKLASAMADVNVVIDKSKDLINESAAGFDGLSYSIGDVAEEIKAFDEIAAESGLSQEEMLSAIDNTYEGAFVKVNKLSDYVGNLTENLKLNTGESLTLARAITSFDGSTGSVESLSKALIEVGESTGTANGAYSVFASKILDSIVDIAEGRAKLEDLESALDNLANAGGVDAQNAINDLSLKVRVLNEELINGKLAAEILSAQMSAGAKSGTTEANAIAELVRSMFELNNELDAQEERRKAANKEAEKAQSDAEKAIKSHDDQVTALKLLDEQLGLTADEIVIFGEVQKSVARGDTPEQTEAIRQQTIAFLAHKKAVSDTDDYNKWVDSIETVSTKIADLSEEILLTQKAIESGDISELVGSEYIDDLNEQINTVKASQDNVYSSMINGSSEALEAIQNLTEQGSSEYEALTQAIQAAAIAQALLTGNYLGAAASATSLLSGLGGDLTAEYEAIQDSQYLDEWGDKANSISESTAITASATEDLVGINTDMLAALEDLTLAISSASSIVATNIDTPTVNTSGLYESNVLDYIGWFNFSDLFGSNILTETLDFLSFDWLFDTIGSWLGGSSSVSDEGIRIIGGTISDLIDETVVQAYQTIKYKTWVWGSSKTKTVYEDAGDEISNQFALVFESLADSVYSAASMLGMSSEEINAALDTFVIETGSISLENLSSDEIADEIEAYFSTVFSDLSEYVIPFLEDFQDAGEELSDTLTKLANEVAIATYLTDYLGVSFGSIADDNIAYLTAIDNIVELFGSVDELSSSISSFVSAFATDSQLLEMYQSSLVDALSEVGLSLPTTTQGFYDLLSSIDATTAAGQEQIATLLSLTDSASEYYDLLEDNQDLADEFRDLADSLYDLSDATTTTSIDAALAAARLGDLSLAQDLDTSDISLDEEDFSSALEYNLARAELASKLNELADLTDGSTSIDESQLSVLEEIRDAINSGAMTSSGFTDEIATLKQQMYTMQATANQYLQRMVYGVTTVRVES